MVFAQSQPMGLILDDEGYEELPIISEEHGFSSGQKSIPLRLDLSPYCPSVRHQGDVPSCVGWSAGYGAMTIERAIRNNWNDQNEISENASSALFVYNLLATGDCGALRMPEALKALQEKGNCLARDFDFDIEDCNKEVPEVLIEKAADYRIEEFVRLFNIKDSDTIKINTTKMILAQQKPVVVGMKVLNNFFGIGNGDISWIPTIGDQTYAGGHAMVVVGYDDEKFNPGRRDVAPNMKGAFKIMNSWGKNWGADGFIWVRYAHFAAYCRHAYALVMEGGNPIDFELDITPEDDTKTGRALRTISGAFGFRQYTGQWLDEKPLFSEQNIQLIGNHYLLDGRKQGDQFQLYVTSELKQGYIYVFSVDPQGKTEVHFPKSEEYNENHLGQNESALLLSKGSSIVVPGQDKALSISHIGDDHLIVLFSESRIKPKYIQFLGRELVNASENIEAKLPRLLTKHMIPFSDITYDKEQMGFSVETRSEGKIVPIILKVRAE